MKNVFKAIGMLVLYFLLVFLSMFPGFLSAYAWFCFPVIAALISAAPVLWAAKRWRKFGAICIFPLVWFLAMFAMGELSYIESIVSALVVAFAAEGVRALAGYDSQNGARLAYATAAVVPVAKHVIMFTQSAMYYEGAVEEMGSVAYANTIASLTASPLMLVALIVVTFAVGYLGAILAEKIFKKATVFE